jgi:hypothetical protein
MVQDPAEYHPQPKLNSAPMKSPRFDARAGVLRKIFFPDNLELVWRNKVRSSMREQYLNDGIDIGVDTLADAKRVLKSVDLVLQARQVRLNSGKTLILKQAEALRHFRVMENGRLHVMKSRVDRKRKAGADTDLERRVIELRIRRGLATRSFDNGNGEKILKRWIGLAATVSASIRPSDLLRLFFFRPAVRDTVCTYIRRLPGSSLRTTRCRSGCWPLMPCHTTRSARSIDGRRQRRCSAGPPDPCGTACRHPCKCEERRSAVRGSAPTNSR